MGSFFSNSIQKNVFYYITKSTKLNIFITILSRNEEDLNY